MTMHPDWFQEPPTIEEPKKPTARERILQFVADKPIFYATEITDSLRIDSRTTTRWLKRLLADGHIQRIDADVPPSPEQRTRIKEILANGIQTNHLRNAKWYSLSEDIQDAP